MASRSTGDSAPEALLERMRTLYTRLDHAHPHTPEYEHLSEQIHELAIVYNKLVNAQQGIDRPDLKP